jgi:hypothetical protein
MHDNSMAACVSIKLAYNGDGMSGVFGRLGYSGFTTHHRDFG